MSNDNNSKRIYERGLLNSLEHYVVIRFFNRFPKRNKILDRKTTKKENEYLVKKIIVLFNKKSNII